MFALGPKSLKELEGVNPGLVAIVHRAIRTTKVDFGVHDGLRTIEEQRRLVKAKASRTMDSKHLKGLAVDLVPFINGKLRWEWEPIYHIAEAVHKAALEERVSLRWGGVWDRSFNGLPGTARALKMEVESYVDRRRKLGRSAFIDGPHFEIR